MYATLKNNQLITQGYDGTQLITDVDGPGVYQVRTCRERDSVVEFGSGMVEVGENDIYAELKNFMVWLDILHHKVEILTPAEGGTARAWQEQIATWPTKVEILCPANPADYAQKTR